MLELCDKELWQTDGQVKNIILLGLPCDIINYGTEMIHEISYSNFNNTKTVLTSYLKFTSDLLKLWNSQRRVEYANTLILPKFKSLGLFICYVRSDSDLPCDRKKKLEFNLVEPINIEILIADKKWLISGLGCKNVN
jgi:hypothetical protein